MNTIHDAKFFAILADETKAVQNKGYIRWVDDQLDIHGDVIGLVHIGKKPTPSRCTLPLKYVIIRCSRPLSHCRGQGLIGLGKRVEADETCAIPVHCILRCLKVFARSTRQCSIIRDSLDIMHDISKLISNSPKSRPSFQPNVKAIITRRPWFEASVQPDGLCVPVQPTPSSRTTKHWSPHSMKRRAARWRILPIG